MIFIVSAFTPAGNIRTSPERPRMNPAIGPAAVVSRPARHPVRLPMLLKIVTFVIVRQLPYRLKVPVLFILRA